MVFSEMVKKVRTNLCMSQTQFADVLSVSFSTINRWENDKASPSKLAKKSFFDFCEKNYIDLDSL